MVPITKKHFGQVGWSVTVGSGDRDLMVAQSSLNLEIFEHACPFLKCLGFFIVVVIVVHFGNKWEPFLSQHTFKFLIEFAASLVIGAAT